MCDVINLVSVSLNLDEAKLHVLFVNSTHSHVYMLKLTCVCHIEEPVEGVKSSSHHHVFVFGAADPKIWLTKTNEIV